MIENLAGLYELLETLGQLAHDAYVITHVFGRATWLLRVMWAGTCTVSVFAIISYTTFRCVRWCNPSSDR